MRLPKEEIVAIWNLESKFKKKRNKTSVFHAANNLKERLSIYQQSQTWFRHDAKEVSGKMVYNSALTGERIRWPYK
jgi:membrane-bound lytic murein transglycosylase B